MRRRLVYSLAMGTVLLGSVLALPAAMASADVVTPAGACTATGHWLHAGFTKTSSSYSPSDVVTVPQRDTVDWQGQEMGKPIGYVGPTRPIDGKVQVEVPFGIEVTIWHWGGDKSPRYSNEGLEHYDVPSALIGIKLKLSGFEKDNGATVCSGSVYVEVTGSKIKNPLGWAAAAGTVIFLAGMLAAGFRKTRLAYDDLNP